MTVSELSSGGLKDKAGVILYVKWDEVNTHEQMLQKIIKNYFYQKAIVPFLQHCKKLLYANFACQDINCVLIYGKKTFPFVIASLTFMVLDYIVFYLKKHMIIYFSDKNVYVCFLCLLLQLSSIKWI